MTRNGYALVATDAEALGAAAPIEPDAVRSHRVLKADGVRLVCIALDAGQVLADHTATSPVLVHVLEGRVVVGIDDDEVVLGAGGILHIDARVRHALRAEGSARVLLTVLHGAASGEHAQAASTTAGGLERVAPAAHHSDLGLTEKVAGATCACAEAESEHLPVLDVREIPHAIRHAAVFGAMEARRPGDGIVLVAHHDPVPLLAQLEQRFGSVSVDYLERGPERWRLRVLRA
jgi:uncharacterized protein (DUF2249 family)/quercetin dioxygenase-like cupin family protein